MTLVGRSVSDVATDVRADAISLQEVAKVLSSVFQELDRASPIFRKDDMRRLQRSQQRGAVNLLMMPEETVVVLALAAVMASG
mmetsp:Transcript_3098/g.9009  ORF Transcript_3098/g.9009 Transcript_3098/m.9009 type:complete len:83 (-) Transcript_3098:548-796(-)